MENLTTNAALRLQFMSRPINQNENSNIKSIDISNIVKPTAVFHTKVIKITLQIFIKLSDVKFNKVSFFISQFVTCYRQQDIAVIIGSLPGCEHS